MTYVCVSECLGLKIFRSVTPQPRTRLLHSGWERVYLWLYAWLARDVGGGAAKTRAAQLVVLAKTTSIRHWAMGQRVVIHRANIMIPISGSNACRFIS